MTLRSLCLTSTLLLSTPALAATWLPWQAGDEATYATTLGSPEEVSIDNTYGGAWVHYSNFIGVGPYWVATGLPGEEVRVYSSSTGPMTLVDFDDPVGTSRRISMGYCNTAPATLAAKDLTVTTPAGVFEDVIRMDFGISCADGGTTSAWFAPGVGVIKWTQESIAGPVTYTMVDGEVGGVKLPMPEPVSVEGGFDKVEAWINMMPPVGGPPTTVSGRLRLQNNTNADIVLQFLGGQAFEVSILDSTGAVVSRWSRGMAFHRAIWRDRIRPGDARWFAGAVDLVDDHGAPLPQGNYTVRIEVTSAPTSLTSHGPGSQRFAIEAPVSIGWAF